jgi:hypothetical protein
MTSPVRIFIDSGAFSAWKLGKPVDLEAYCHFLLDNQDWYDVAAALDEIIPDDPELAARRSMDNLIYMRAMGLDPIPVWHVRESTDWIKRMLDLGCGYIGLSATSIVSRSATDDWYELAWSFLVDNSGAPLVRVHSFGESRQEILTRYPWASADSSTWLEGEKRGTLIMPDGTWLGHTKTRDSSPGRQDIDLLEGDDAVEFNAVIEQLGIDRAAFEDRSSRAARAARSMITASRFREIQREVRSRLPIRSKPSGGGLITGGSRGPEKRSYDFPDEFNLYLAAGTNALAMPCAHELGMRNILASYFYLPAKATALLKSYKADPEAAMLAHPYDKYTALIRSILRKKVEDAVVEPPVPPGPVLTAGQLVSAER